MTDRDRDRPVASVSLSAPINPGEQAYPHAEPELQSSKFNILQNDDLPTEIDYPLEPYLEKEDEHEFQNLFRSRFSSPRERQFTIGPPLIYHLSSQIFSTVTP